MDGGEDPELAPAQWAPMATPDEIARFAATADLGTGLLTPFGVLDPAALSDAGRIDALVGVARLQAWAAAQEQRLLAAMAPTADVMEAGFLADEIACALRL